MGGTPCKEAGVLCGCVTTEDPSNEVRTEVPSYNGLGSTEVPVSTSAPAPYAQVQTMGTDEYSSPLMAPPPGGAGGGITFDQILSSLDAAEEQAYGDAFRSFAGGAPVPIDNAQMRTFLGNNALLDDLDIDLMKVMNDTMQIEVGAFVQLLRQYAISDGIALGQFQALSADQQQMAAEECRSGLTMMCMETLGANLGEQRWDCILNMVMMDAGPSVPMEQWLFYAKMAARYVRLVNYCQA